MLIGEAMPTLGFVEYGNASPEVRAVYDDIMATRKTDWINNFWKAIAHDPATLKRTWEDVTDEQLFARLDEEMNSIAIIVKHMTGNMRSRWTDFLTSDGEKPDRNRDTEFVDPPATRGELLRRWNQGWDSIFHALDPLTDSDLERKVTIRGEPHSVMPGQSQRTM